MKTLRILAILGGLLVGSAVGAQEKISAMTPAATPTGTEYVPGVQSGANVKIQLSQFLSYVENSPQLVTPYLGQPTYLDGLYASDIPSTALVGTIPYSLLPGSSVRYVNGTSGQAASGDNGNVINFQCSGSPTLTFYDIGTNGITPNAYQTFVFNGCSGAMTVVATSTTLVNGQAVGSGTPTQIPAGTGAFVIADANNSSLGNYNYTVGLGGGGGGGVTTGANTFTAAQTISMSAPALEMADTGQSGTNITDWGVTLTSGTHGEFCVTTFNDGFASPTCGFGIARAVSGTNGAEIAYMTFGTANVSPIAYSYNFPGLSPAVFGGPVKTPQMVLLNGGSGCASTGQSCFWQSATANTVFVGSGVGNTQTTYGEWNAAGNFLNFFDEYIEEASPRLILWDTNQNSSTNLEITQIAYGSGALTIGSLTDSPTFGAGYALITGTRGASGAGTGPAWTNIALGCSACSTTITGNGNFTNSGWDKAAAFIVTGSTIGAAGTSGFYNPAGTELGCFTNGVSCGFWDSAQNSVPTGLIVSKGTGPALTSLTDCTGSTVNASGGPLSVFIQLTGCSTSSTNVTFTLTWPTDTQIVIGPNCVGQDQTEKKNVFETSESATSGVPVGNYFLSAVTTATINLTLVCIAS